MKELKDDGYHMYIENGIVFVIFLKQDYNYDDIDRGIKMRKQITAGKPCLLLSDIRKIRFGSREARQRMSDKDAGEGVVAVAIVLSSKIQQMLFNFFATIYKSPAPAKVFSDIESAKEWLQQYKDLPNAKE